MRAERQRGDGGEIRRPALALLLQKPAGERGFAFFPDARGHGCGGGGIACRGIQHGTHAADDGVVGDAVGIPAILPEQQPLDVALLGFAYLQVAAFRERRIHALGACVAFLSSGKPGGVGKHVGGGNVVHGEAVRARAEKAAVQAGIQVVRAAGAVEVAQRVGGVHEARIGADVVHLHGSGGLLALSGGGCLIVEVRALVGGSKVVGAQPVSHPGPLPLERVVVKGKPYGTLERGALEAAQQHIVGDSAVEGELKRLVLRRVHGRCLPQVALRKRVRPVSRLVGGLRNACAQRVDGGRGDI